MIDVDGSEGGGGVLRTALGLSIATGDPVRIDDLRGNRPEPGLKSQHVACLEAARLVADGDTTGVELGSERVTFEPGSVADDEATARNPYAGDETAAEPTVDVGTAGSATLVASTVLPAALVAERTVRLRIAGGTDVAWSPPLEYFAGVTLPALRAHGLAVGLDALRRGFYPAGGGEIRLTLGPSTPDPIEVAEPRGIDRIDAAAVASADLLEADVADRMVREAGDRLADDGVTVGSRSARYVETDSTGAVIVLRVVSGGEDGDDGVGGDRTPGSVPTAGFSALGEAGVPSETVAREAVDGFREWRAGPGVVDAHLADQFVPWLALVGGAVRVPAVTDHVASAIAVARAFGLEVGVDRDAAAGDGAVLRGSGRLDP
ncbi:RNA 3'-terminal phosphate cyclase (ATP) [Halorubrum aquaticum]|uniref:RNA 3'-terminal phosphate cyclase n=1 Tax=Halorubrum aquaticum TaxID=387340 RepID=A0A1I2ZX75_9EURY|nr:RNA 3'-terminal phosphate cyclase [Halorubrum aquaticum]SFH42280.1 RNA 3'-terminal phosphate cyclase (ATP) [Halorubrum aquaticum]